MREGDADADTDVDVDNVDRAILYELQRDARNNTNAQISKRVGVSPSTVGKRIRRLEDAGIIDGYRTDIAYARVGLPLRTLFVCTTSIAEREDLVHEALALDSVVTVRELMTGQRNVHIETVARTNEELTRIAHEIDELGFTVNDEILLRSEYTTPLERLRTAPPADEP